MESVWTLHTKSNGRQYATGLTADWPTVAIGREVPVRFRTAHGSLVVESGETHTVPAGEIEIYTDTTVRDGGTLNTDGTLIRTGVANFNPWIEYAGAADWGLDHDALPYFREQLPDRARVGSLVIGFEPSAELKEQTVDGFWGLVTGGTDRTNVTFTNREVELRVFVLGRYRDWARSDLEAAMQA